MTRHEISFRFAHVNAITFFHGRRNEAPGKRPLNVQVTQKGTVNVSFTNGSQRNYNPHIDAERKQNYSIKTLYVILHSYIIGINTIKNKKNNQNGHVNIRCNINRK